MRRRVDDVRVVAVRWDPVVLADAVEAVEPAGPLARLPAAALAGRPAAWAEPGEAARAAPGGVGCAEPAGDGAMPHRLQ